MITPLNVLQHACDAAACRTGLARRTMAATTVDSVISSSESTGCLDLDYSLYPKLSTLNPKDSLGAWPRCCGRPRHTKNDVTDYTIGPV